MKAFRAPMRELGEFEELKAEIGKQEGMLEVSGCVDGQKAQFIDALGEGRRARVIVTANDLRAKELCENYRLFDRNVLYFPARDFIFFQADVHSNLLELQRMAVWKALTGEEPVTVVTTIQALMNHLMPFEEWKKHIRKICVGDQVETADIRQELIDLGYERCPQAENPGQFALRGGIIDIYPMAEEVPVRIELFGDEVDSIRSFDPKTQRSIEELQEFELYPAAEMITDTAGRKKALEKVRKESAKQEKLFRDKQLHEEAHRSKLIGADLADRLEQFEDVRNLDGFMDYFYAKPSSLMEAFPKDTLWVLDEPNRLTEAADAALAEYRDSMQHRLEKGYVLPGQTSLLFDVQKIAGWMNRQGSVGLCTLESPRGSWKIARRFSLSVHTMSPYNNSFELLVKDMKRWKKEGYRVILLCASRTRGSRMAQELRDEELNAVYSEDEERLVQPGEVLVLHGNAHRGYAYPLLKFAVIAESDIFGQQKKTRKKKKSAATGGQAVSSFSELSPGDYVVHESHGLGVYRGIENIDVNHVQKDYMKIEYADGGVLYVLPTQLDVIQKYADASSGKPKLNKLGGTEWRKTKTKVKRAVEEIAQELVDLYAARQHAEGFSYGPDTVWQREFEEMFPFQETEDQLKAIEETKRDMESGAVMDRLVCGDVGYGKTEIALRAAFKAVQDGKQVAYLVPTTILAQQHYNTFVQRMKEFPVRVELLCRFTTPAQVKKTLADLKRGTVDIVIGTHRLLSKDVVFKDLGLLVVDEEQRFGVTHKEKIKQMKNDVDVLTLTATPIPRTLHMSLSGIREMSVLEEAPHERLPIQTFVLEYNEEMIREAINRELARDGQVFYVYNRVNTIQDVAARLSKLVPDARIGVAHGQRKERELESILYDFINGEIDVLVSTTIIETGIDIANVNTMIIQDADRMGLSQLYQLRGRIGRSNRTAYAFLMYKRDRMLKEEAEKRLSAIREFTELGSGFKIAMRDLEIRGAGNILGGAQSGHMAAVGYDLYCKLLNESVQSITGKADGRAAFDTAIDLDIDAYIPDSYIRTEEQKLDVYKRIASITGQEEYDDMVEELLDRFGNLPESVLKLLRIAHLKTIAHRLYLTDVKQRGDEIVFSVYPQAKLDVSKVGQFLTGQKGRVSMRVSQGVPAFTYTRPKGGKVDVLDAVQGVLDGMSIMEEA